MSRHPGNGSPRGGTKTVFRRNPNAAARTFTPGIRALLAFYESLWRPAPPILRRNPRLRDGWDQRVLRRPLPRADLWIQAASAGEAYLARELFRAADGFPGIRVLVTTGTRQGMEILAAEDGWDRAFFPLDRPSWMARAVGQVRPRAAVLLETELWPGHLAALRARGVPVLLLNGRITEGSLRGYRRMGGLWRALRPERVAAISPADADRFASLFGPAGVTVTPNIKFDRMRISAFSDEIPPSSRNRWFAAEAPVVVLGSIREEEESEVFRMVKRVRESVPAAIVALAPRHLHRVPTWTERLSGEGIPRALRSGLQSPAPAGRIVIWDTFGELGRLYECADAVFVGGGLAPLGGQNFMEPLAAGRIPVIGPSWSNFAWIGEEIFREGLAVRASDGERAANVLLSLLQHPPNRDRVLEKARKFVGARSGGARMAAEMVWRRLENL